MNLQNIQTYCDAITLALKEINEQLDHINMQMKEIEGELQTKDELDPVVIGVLTEEKN